MELILQDSRRTFNALQKYGPQKEKSRGLNTDRARIVSVFRPRFIRGPVWLRVAVTRPSNWPSDEKASNQRKESCLHPGFILDSFWVILGSFWVDPGWVIARKTPGKQANS
jgi:hypothetical protein